MVPQMGSRWRETDEGKIRGSTRTEMKAFVDSWEEGALKYGLGTEYLSGMRCVACWICMRHT